MDGMDWTFNFIRFGLMLFSETVGGCSWGLMGIVKGCGLMSCFGMILVLVLTCS